MVVASVKRCLPLVVLLHADLIEGIAKVDRGEDLSLA
jgi:hypothetical protein